jgi:general secretion pathway protein E
MAQRLVKTICPHCVESFEMAGSDLSKMGFPVVKAGKITLKRGSGCSECRGTGYKGRCGIFEIFPLTPQIKTMIGEEKQTLEMQQVAIREGMTTLREDAWKKVKEGITTYEEALLVTSA